MNFRTFKRGTAVAIAAAFFAFSCAVFGTTPAIAGKPRCTVKGTKGPDKLFGTRGRDVICGFGGKDVIWGLTGNDLIYGGRGDDTIRAGKGNDHLYGQPNDDTLYAGLGNDYLDGGPGENTLVTGPGENKCVDRETDTRTPGCDDQAPVVAGLSVDQQEIDTTLAKRTVTVTLRVTDDLAGLREIPSIEVFHQKTNQRRWVNLSRVSGDDMDGIYEGTVTLPKSAPTGRYGLYVSAIDRQENLVDIGPRELEKLGFDSGFDQTGPGDSKGPEIKALSVDRTSIDTSTSAQTVNFTLRMTDDISGIGSDFYPHAVEVILDRYDPEASMQANNLTLTSGDEKDGIWQGSITFPQGSPQAVWKIRVGAVDWAGNMSLISNVDLINLGAPAEITQTGSGS